MSGKEEFIGLIEEHKGLINKVTFLYADDPEDRRDLRQEIISQAWSSFRSYRGDAKFSTWLYRVALNTAISTLRKSKKQNEMKQQIIHDNSVGSTSEAELIEAILKVLNPVEKSIVLLLVEGYSQQDIAHVLGISGGNTRTKIHRIRKKLENYGIKDLASK